MASARLLRTPLRYIWILHSKNDSGGKLVGMVKFGWSLHRSVLGRNRNQNPPLCEPIGADSKVVRGGVLASEPQLRPLAIPPAPQHAALVRVAIAAGKDL